MFWAGLVFIQAESQESLDFVTLPGSSGSWSKKSGQPRALLELHQLTLPNIRLEWEWTGLHCGCLCCRNRELLPELSPEELKEAQDLKIWWPSIISSVKMLAHVLFRFSDYRVHCIAPSAVACVFGSSCIIRDARNAGTSCSWSKKGHKGAMNVLTVSTCLNQPSSQ